MSGDDAAERMAEYLRAAGWKLTPPPPEPPVYTCLWDGCDTTDEQEALIDVTVEVNRSEEGHATVRRFVCGWHSDEAMRALVRLGFGSHRHGGINFLEAPCPGSDDMTACPVYTADQMYEMGAGETEER